MDPIEPITDKDLQQLPRWARVAFAARCGRRVQRLIRRFWQNGTPEVLQAFDTAIALAEQSAAQARVNEGLEKALRAAETYAPAMAGMAQVQASGAPPARVPASELDD